MTSAERSRHDKIEVYADALDIASMQGHKTIIQMLLTNGATVWSCTVAGAAGKGYEDIVRLLLDGMNGQTTTILQAASGFGHEAIVRLLLDKGVDINTQEEEYGTALQIASEKGHEAIVRLLLGKGANINVLGGEYGIALQAASNKGHEAIWDYCWTKELTSMFRENGVQPHCRPHRQKDMRQL